MKRLVVFLLSLEFLLSREWISEEKNHMRRIRKMHIHYRLLAPFGKAISVTFTYCLFVTFGYCSFAM